MEKLFTCFAAVAALVTISCSKQEVVNETTSPSVSQPKGIITKGVGEKEPSTFVYVETNDVNPLNAMDYYLSNGDTFFDYVGFFAANIHKETVQVNNGTEERPTIYLNPELCPYLCNNGSPVTTYTSAISNNGQSPILCVLGDWVGLGVSNMNSTQQYQLAYILCCIVNQCGFDGVLFDDEYSGSNTITNGSYSGVISYFRQLCPDKLIFVFDWGGTSYISSTAAGEIDYAHHGYFGYYLPYTYSNIPGMDPSRWSPISLNLGQTYTSSALSTIQTWAYNAKQSGYGQIMLYNLREKDDVNPIPVLSAIATGAGWNTPVTCLTGGGNRPQLTPVTGGCTITYDMALNCCN